MLGRALAPMRSLARARLGVAAAHSNAEFKPGPYPKTKEERLAAAKKYNLHPDKYEPYPDDGMGYGDYPKLPMISTEARSDFYPWDNPVFKRNFDEPIHVDEQNINDTRVNVNHRYLVPIKDQLLYFVSCITAIVTVYLLFENIKMFPPISAKQYPKDGAHYTFESPKSVSSSSH